MTRRRPGRRERAEWPDDAVRVVPPAAGGTGGADEGVRSAAVWAGVAAAIVLGGLGFLAGYTIGADRDEPTETTEAAPVELSTSTIATTATREPELPEAPPETVTTTNEEVAFPPTTQSLTRIAPGHQVPEGATELLDPYTIDDLDIGPDGSIWTVGPGGVVRWDPGEGTATPLTLPDGTGPVGCSHIAVAPTGEVWAGCGARLAYWDGVEWRQGRYRDIDEITALAAGDDGTVWVATIAWDWGDPWFVQGLIHVGEGFFPGDLAAVEVPGFVQKLTATPDGSVWALVEGRLWRATNDRWTPAIDDEPLPWVHDFAVDPDGGVWILTDSGFVYEYPDPTGPDPARTRHHLGYGVEVLWITATPTGEVWAAVTTEPESVEEEGESELILVDDMTRHPAPEWRWNADPVVGDGLLWIGTDEGPMAFDGWTWSAFPSDPEFGIRDVWGMAVDGDGTLWVTDGQDLAAWDGAAWVRHDTTQLGQVSAPGLWTPETHVWVVSGRDGTLWAGVACRPSLRQSDGWVSFDPPIEIGAGWCDSWDQLVAPDGSLWLTIASSGPTALYRHDGTAWSAGQRNDDIGAFAVGDDGTVWGVGDGVEVLEDGTWVTLLEGVYFHSVIVDADGSVWAATSRYTGWEDDSGGLWVFRDGTWERTTSPASADRLIAGADGRVWILGQDADGRSGVFRQRDSGGFEAIVLDTEVRLLVPDPTGGMWAGGEGRLLHLEE